MDNSEFLKLVNDLAARLDGKAPDPEEIKRALGGDLNDDQIEAVIEYIRDRQYCGGLSGSEAQYVRNYAASWPETGDLTGKAFSELSFEDLIRGYQRHVINAAGRIREDGFDISDLISEGNLALVEAAAEMAEELKASADLFGDEASDIHSRIISAVEEGIAGFISMTKELNASDDRLVEQVNLLNSTIDRMTEENGFKPNIDELANELGIPQHRVLDIIDLAGKDSEEEDQR